MVLEVREWTDQASWDTFLGSQKSAHYHQSFGWAEVIRFLGARVFLRAVVDGDEIKAVMLVASNEIRHVRVRLLYINRGPVVDKANEKVFRALIDDLDRLAKSEGAVCERIEPMIEVGDQEWPDLYRRFGFAPLNPPGQPRSQWVIDLRPDHEGILAEMKPKWRYNIRLAEKRGVTIERGGVNLIDDFYALYTETSQRDGFYIHDKSVYQNTFQTFERLGQHDVFIARLDGQPIAGLTLITIGGTSWYAYGASSNSHRDVMAPHALQWQAMQTAKERGAISYDMRGVADTTDPNNDMSGVLRFKRGFGGRQLTTIEQYWKPTQRPLGDLWRLYWIGRFRTVTAQRKRKGLPYRSWA